MPELPDLIVYKQYSDATSLHQRIKTVDVDDDTVLRDLSVPHFRETLILQEELLALFMKKEQYLATSKKDS